MPFLPPRVSCGRQPADAAPTPSARRRLLVSLLAAGLAAGGGWALGQAGQGPEGMPAVDESRLYAAARNEGPLAVDGVRALLEMLLQAMQADERGRLRAVNDFFNRRIAFMDDIDARGLVDHWSSPVETLGRGSGDCEDYAIAKYFGLLALGLPARRLRLVYVRAQLGGVGGPTQAHMVLAHYVEPAAEPTILDNLVPDLLPASARRDLTPVFSFNGEGLWEGTAGRSAGDPVVRLSRWREVLAKARAEGFL